ncbi:MAG: hypothetical protein M9959_06560 [Chitinophagaceae bacterium]|nr:hypothetical protein [Chitinophagaceae bacterium]
MISKTLVQELRSSAQWLTKESILDILEERISQAEKAEAEAKENKPTQPTQAEVEEIVRQMNF